MPACRAARRRAVERRARGFRSEPPDGDAGDHELAGDLRGRRQRRGVDLGQRALGLVEAPEKEKSARLDVTRMGGVGEVAVPFERRPRRRERLRRPIQVARDERDLGLGHHASGARDRLSRTEGACGAAQQRLRLGEIAELRHRDAAQRQRRCIVAQRNAVQRAERIAGLRARAPRP